jgi:DinB family protein
MLRPMDPLVGLVFGAWDDFDRVLNGLSAGDAGLQPGGQSSAAWALGHVTEHLDRWINHTLQGRDRDALLGVDRFRMGSPGAADDWDAIRTATQEVRAAARPYLEGITADRLDERYEFQGAISGELGGLTLRYALMRIGAHHYFHIGVIACQRDLRGDSVGDYPGLMRSANDG